MLVAKCTILFETLRDDFFQFRWTSRIASNKCGGWTVQDRFKNNSRARSKERKSAAHHFVEHDPEGEEIGAPVEIFGSNLLWRHIGHGAAISARDCVWIVWNG